MRNVIFILCIAFVFSCARKEPVRPSGVLSEEDMVALLQEIYLTESKISKLSLPFDSSKALYNMVEEELFRRHDINDTIYERSMNWYYEHPQKLMIVYEVLVDSLMVLEKRYQENVGNYRQPSDGGSARE